MNDKPNTKPPSTAELLRRRAKFFRDQEGYNNQTIGVMLRAADELEVLELVQKTMGPQEYVEVVSDCRRMRQAIGHAIRVVSGLPMDRKLRANLVQTLSHTLTARAEVGGKIRIMAVQLGTVDRTDDRTNVEGRIKLLLDAFYEEQEKNRVEKSKGPQAAAGEETRSIARGPHAEQPSADERDRGAQGNCAGLRSPAGEAD